MESKITYSPVGTYHSEQKNPIDAGRQPDAFHTPGYIELFKGQNFEQALTGLDLFSHIWIVFQFHHNENWKPMIAPPRGISGKVGVFASRAPYRPNNIGISAVRLEKIEGLKLYVTEADILDGSPILDIKPYLSYADSKPQATDGWIADEDKYQISYSVKASEQIQWLKKDVSQLEAFIQHQLEFEPTNQKKKRVKKLSTGLYTLAYRTWRLSFKIIEKNIEILEIFSGYSQVDFEKQEDLYKDKNLHQKFNLQFKH